MVRGVKVDPFLSQGPVAPLIAAELRGRMELPRGEAARIARKLDCSRERVRQIMEKLGVRVEPSQAKVIDCSDCRREIRINKGGICADCLRRRSLVELTCIFCGKKFYRRRKDYNDFLRRVPARGKRYGPQCSKACVRSVSRNCSWCGDSVGWRPPSHSGQHVFCGKPRNCWSETMKLVQPTQWPLIGPAVLPMREHVAEIAALLGPERLTGGKPKPQ